MNANQLASESVFADEPLLMVRAARIAAQTGEPALADELESIKAHAEAIRTVPVEDITTELQLIMATAKPSVGWDFLLRAGLLPIIFPELAALKGVETVNGRGHKDNFYHTLEVLDNVAAKSEKLWLRWAALLHDIAKPYTKRWVEGIGWTFHNHNYLGAKKVPGIFSRLKLPMGPEMEYVQRLVELHMRPIALVEEEVTDSAVRRLHTSAGDDLDDLMILARADITSKNIAKKQRFLDNFDLVDRKFRDIAAKDEDAKFRPAINGHHIMAIFGIPQGESVGFFMKKLYQATKENTKIIENTPEACCEYILKIAPEIGLEPLPGINPLEICTTSLSE